MEKQYYISKEQFIALKEAWKQKSNHSAAEMIIYNILRSKPADNGFTQGGTAWEGFKKAWQEAIYLLSMRRVYGKLPGATYNGFSDAPGKMEAEFKARFGIEPPATLKEKIQEAKK